ncbi:putative exporter [Luteibacter sp. Sphag1AF]|uniref:MMPL family transporter n=1 Tax=Luteibacter sp. Sphag1AF TaxID=2587031 RepID=UPI00160EBC3B|nr:MMPL family transporter [Luteibacter sp. Sphag1AF]MBB3227260.1 putative exporter [Luteibacter sp. Sphag1AF]
MRLTPGLRASLFGLGALVLTLLGAWLLFGRGTSPLQTDLLAMLPPTERQPVAEEAVERLSRASGDRLVFLLASKNDDDAKDAARTFGAALAGKPGIASAIAELPPFDLDQLTTPFLPFRFHLLTAADRALWQAPSPDVAGMLTRRLNEPFGAGIGTRLTDDPFGTLQHWLNTQPFNRSTLIPEDDLLTAHRGDTTYVMVIATLAGSSYDDQIQRPALASVEAATHTVTAAHPDVHILRTGTMFYAAAARAGAERDVHVVGIASTVGIALLLIGVFRSPRPLLLAFLSTAIGVIAAITITIAIFGQLHLLTLVFGAALLGEAVDYSIQYLCARANAAQAWNAEAGVRQVRPALLLALATSLLGYALLGMVPFPALRQMACFAIVGMLVACFSVLWLLPALARPAARRPVSPALSRIALSWQRPVSTLAQARRGLVVLGVLVVAAAPGWCLLDHDDDIHLLISPPAVLEQDTRDIASIAGMGTGSQFYLVQGDTVEQTLQHEEALTARLQAMIEAKQLDAWTGVTTMLPSAQRQQSNRDAFARVLENRSVLADAAEKAGFRAGALDAFANAWPGRPMTLDDWMAMPVSMPFHYLWMGQRGHAFASIVLPQGQDDSAQLAAAADGLPGITFVDKPASVSALFGRYRGYADVWLGAALLLVGVAFAWRYGLRAAPRVLAPPLLGIGLTLAALGYLGQPLTLFHVMALMLVLGVGANYAVFLREGEPHTAQRPGAAYAGVLLSAITALLSFGLLALSTMPALRHFGTTLLLGIGFTVLLAPVSLPRETSR